MKSYRSLLSIFLVFLILVGNSFGFKDVTDEVNRVSEKFSQEGMFGSFMYQYGNDLFRPDGYVTRENLILVLKEYHVIISRLMNQNRKISDKLNSLKSQGLSNKNMDRILREFQKTLDPMLESSNTIKSLRQKFAVTKTAPVGAVKTPADVRLELKKLADKISEMEQSQKAESSASEFSDKGAYVSGSKSLKKAINDIKMKLSYMKKDLNMQKTQITGIAKERTMSFNEINKLKTKYKRLSAQIENIDTDKADGAVVKMKPASKREADNLKKELNSIKKEILALKSEFSKRPGKKDKKNRKKDPVKGQDKISDELDDIRKELAGIKKDIDSIENRSRTVSKNGSSSGIVPIWAKISIGFSTIALFFMAR